MSGLELILHPAHDADTSGFGPRTYRRRVGDRLTAFEFNFSSELVQKLFALYHGDADAETEREIGAEIERFLQLAGVSLNDATSRITICSDADEVYALPFELASRGSGWLGLAPGVSLRYRWPDVISDPAANPRGRVLFAWAAPDASVPHEEHQKKLDARCSSWLSFDPDRDVIPQATRAAIADRLKRDEDVRVLHLLCHGKQIRRGQYGLALVGDEVTSPTQLATTLAPFRATLRMVVLCACQGGEQGPGARQLGSVARELHRAGIPLVVASRLPLRFDDSVTLTDILYGELRAGFADIDRALASARRAIHDTPGRTYEWASLQLFAAPPRVTARPAAPTSAPVPTIAPGSVKALRQLLQRLFVASDDLQEFIEEWLAGRDDVDLDDVPWGASKTKATRRLVKLLEASGAIDHGLFEALVATRPRQRVRIDEVRAALLGRGDGS